MSSNRLYCLLLALSCLAASARSWAGVTAERTRVIFSEGAREASLLLSNVNPYPVVTQVWVDDGRLDSGPDEKNPIIVLPPIFRLESKAQRSLRLIFIGEKLPEDRESLYWLNIYEIPPMPTDRISSENSVLTVTMRTQMKVFYRPKGLKMSSNDAVEKLRFYLRPDRGQLLLDVKNPTPYHVTLGQVELNAAGQKASMAGAIVEPYSSNNFPVGSVSSEFNFADRVSLRFSWVDDGGNLQWSDASLPNVPRDGLK